jgi:hypothetical protein
MSRVSQVGARIVVGSAFLVLSVMIPIIVTGNVLAQMKPPSVSELSVRVEELKLKQQELQLKMQDTLQERNRQAEELKLKQRELQLKMDDSAFGRSAEFWKAFATVASVLVASLGVGVPLLVAIRTLNAQRKIADDQAATQRTLSIEQAKLQFQMKAAELTLADSENAMQAKEKARALAALFKSELLPKEFAESFDAKEFLLDYGNSNNRRLELIKLVAEYPKERDQILKDWYVLFRWDWWWVEPLLGLDPDGMKRLKALQERLKQNEDEVNRKKDDASSKSEIHKPSAIPPR